MVELTLRALHVKPINPESPIPLYFQVEAHLRAQILSDKVKPGDLLPSELVLAEAYGVGRHTIRTALGRLVSDNLILRKAGHGTVVKAREDRRQFSLTKSFSRQMREMGLVPHSQVLKHEVRTVRASDPQPVSAKKSGALVLELERLRFGNDEPIGLQRSLVILDRCAGLEEIDFSNQSIYQVLADDYRLYINEIAHTVTAAVADERQAGLLQVDVRDPLLVVKTCSLLHGGEIIEYGITFYRADKYEYTTTQTTI